MGFVRHIIGFIAAFLFSVLGAVAMPMASTASHEAEFFPLHAALAVEHTNVHFAARAPPITLANVAVTGDVTVMHGGAFVTHGVETLWASLYFGADLVAPNTGTGARFADQAKLDDHFIRHGADFGATSSAQYQQMADNFLTGPRGTNTLERIRPNGDVVRYDPTTDAFGVVSSNGTVRTYYVPEPAVHGYATNLDYFNAQ